MNKVIYALAIAAATCSVAACNSDNNTIDLRDYQDWRKANDEWIVQIQDKKNDDGTPYYKVVVPVWNPGGFVLMHQFNDPAETADNLVPHSNSTVDVFYNAYNMDDELVDTSKDVNLYGRKGVYRIRCNNVIQGWTAALETMHVGDTVEVVVPYSMGYGTTVYGTLKPYTSMRFNMRLVDIYKYEANGNSN